MSRAKLTVATLAVLVAGCGPEGRVANTADAIEDVSDRYANRTNTRLEKIGNQITPVIENAIDRVDRTNSTVADTSAN